MITNKEKLWNLFSHLLVTAGLNPELYRKYFDEEYETIKTEDPTSQEQIIRVLAKFTIQYEPKHPLPPGVSAMREALKIDEEQDKAKQDIDLSDPASVERYIQTLKELKRKGEKIWNDLELKRAEIKAESLRKSGRNVISVTCLKCGKPLKYIREFEWGLCMDCYSRL